MKKIKTNPTQFQTATFSISIEKSNLSGLEILLLLTKLLSSILTRIYFKYSNLKSDFSWKEKWKTYLNLAPNPN